MSSSDSNSSASVSDQVHPLDWARQHGKGALIRTALAEKRETRRRSRNKSARRTAGVVALVAFCFWAVPFVRDTDQVVTASAQRQTVTLADGSAVDLNARTNLHTDFRYGRRVITLSQGEAFFSVAKDAAHPFLVETPAGTVRVTGTKFNVRVEAGQDSVVTLLEGAVLLAPKDRAEEGTTLQPSEQATLLASGAQVRTLAAREMDQVLSWRVGRLVLDGLTLGEAVNRFAAYHGREITVSPEAVKLIVGGSCPLDNLPGFMEFLEEAFPVNVMATQEGYRIVSR